MEQTIQYFQQILHSAMLIFFKQGCEYRSLEQIPKPENYLLEELSSERELNFEEQVILLLALMPHLAPEVLDVFFVQNKELDRAYTEFGGWKGCSHIGFLPTGQTAAFLLENAKLEPGGGQAIALSLLDKKHGLYKNNIVQLDSENEKEPVLSGKLIVSEEILARINNQKYEPEYNANFPARRITTPLNWEDLVLPYNLCEELDDIACWMKHQNKIRKNEQLNRILKQGYRCLFYGHPGTGKTLTATLLGKQNSRDVYRVDLSMIVSKYIGETEKNLAKIFDKAAHQNWILFFDEADALFGQRTETQSSNDRHANQEIAYLLQRIEDFPGMIILATNFKDNMDDAFFRRFQSALYFPMPDEQLRYLLWKKMLPKEWLDAHSDQLLQLASGYKLSGGSMVNVIQNCAIKLYSENTALLSENVLKQAILKEQLKEGKLIM